LIASLMSIGAAQSACTPVGIAAGAGATAGAAAMSEGGISGAVTDLQIKASINDLWFRSNMDIFRKLSLTVEEGRVLITGVVQNPEHRVEAVRLAWQARGVKQVINEIRVADSEGIQGYVSDTWISAQLRTKMTLDRDVQSINYSIDTVQGIVYLMGTARYPQELQRVTEIARAIPKVKQVVSYVRMRGEAVQAVTPGMAPAAPVAATPLSAPRTSTGTPPMSGDGVTVYDPATSTVLPNGGAGGSVTATPLPPN
jgi:osmotically-inducible protein OsmY